VVPVGQGLKRLASWPNAWQCADVNFAIMHALPLIAGSPRTV
jgi:hypothetical protein